MNFWLVGGDSPIPPVGKNLSQLLDPKSIFQKICCLNKSVKLFLLAFNVIISYIFPENISEIYQDSQRILTIFLSICWVFYLYLPF